MPRQMYKSHVYTISLYFNKKERDLEEKYINNTEEYNVIFRETIKKILKKN